ncbi:phosphatidylinositol-binding protein scs2 [Dinochytrium kinnereticum]|nr:phosphatidylinositol-binding protein scs2 [Dinochytrium kinnereticum]
MEKGERIPTEYVAMERALHARKGAAYFNADKVTEALQDYKKAHALDPENKSIQEDLAAVMAKVKMEAFLSLQPSHDLEFRRPFNNVVKQTLKVTNTHPTEPLAFKVKTTAPKQYCVRPNSGKIPPQSSAEVQVLLQAMKEDPPLDHKCKDKFLVQAIKIQNTDGDDLQELWTRAENLKKVDPEAAKELICEKKLRCVFLPAGVTQTPTSSTTVDSTPAVTADAPAAARTMSGSILKDAAPADADRELRDSRDTIKRLTAACEGYKSEIERLNLLRQRRGAGGNGSEGMAVDSKGGSSAFAAQKGIPMNVVILIALIAFLLGAYLL